MNQRSIDRLLTGIIQLHISWAVDLCRDVPMPLSKFGPVAALALAAALFVVMPALAQPANLTGFDADNDGRTSRSEYRTGLVAGSMKFDRNRDGRITLQELPGFARIPGVKGAVEKVFRSNDLSGDGALSREELDTRAEIRFGELDLDRDGYLGPAEIKAGRRSGGR